MGRSFYGITIKNLLPKILDKSRRKPKMIRVDKSTEFYSRSMKSWLQGNGIEIYSTHNKGNLGLLINDFNIKKVNNDKLDNIVDKYNNTYHRTIKMKSINVKASKYIGFEVKSNDEDPKFKVDDCIRISKYKNIFAKRLHPNWKIFMIQKVKNTVP